jgi:para-nitrobenzyl esterase
VSVQVCTPSGVLEGTEQGGVHVYRGIPYARAPVGERRLRPPEPAAGWSGVRDARTDGAAAPQRGATRRHGRRWRAVPAAGASEDCLFLNVHAPSTGTARRPVLVWIHGGGYTHGSGSWYVYSGLRLARRGDVVVVSINYRLGALGALDLRGFGATDAVANAGLRDQLLALAWVSKHIEAFGGDPENVTVFGQSAGAMSIGALLVAPAARGLIRRAILQSGAMHNVLDSAQAQGIATALLNELAIDPERDDVVAALRTCSADEIVRAQSRVSTSHRLPLGMLAWQPVVDGDLLPTAPAVAPAPADVPLLIGTNRDEWKMFTALDARRRRMDAVTLRGYVERTLARDGVEDQDALDAVLDHYGRCPETGVARTPADAWVALQTDRVFRLPAVDLADRQAAAGGDTFVYRFDWAPGLAPRRVGACHAMEIPFVFGTLRSPLLRPLIGLDPRTLRLSDDIMDAWLAFARTGDPRHAGARDWPAHAPRHGVARVFGGDAGKRPVLEPETRAVWQRVYDAATRPGDLAARA